MLCAVHSRPQEKIRHSILWSQPLTEKEQQQLMATKKGGSKGGAKKGGSKGGSKGGGKKGGGGGKKGGAKKGGSKKR
jgi:hypothetical protein